MAQSEQEYYEVEKILDRYRKEDGTEACKVRWKGYDSNEDSEVPLKEIEESTGGKELLEKFEKERKTWYPEKILDKRINKAGFMEYHVKYEGYEGKENEPYEPLRNLANYGYMDMVNEFEDEMMEMYLKPELDEQIKISKRFKQTINKILGVKKQEGELIFQVEFKTGTNKPILTRWVSGTDVRRKVPELLIKFYEKHMQIEDKGIIQKYSEEDTSRISLGIKAYQNGSTAQRVLGLKKYVDKLVILIEFNTCEGGEMKEPIPAADLRTKDLQLLIEFYEKFITLV